MSMLVVLMCFRSMIECTDANAPLVLRKELTTTGCEREMERIDAETRAGFYVHPRGGRYVMRCDPMEPKA